jgi:hypothetical protein
LKIRSIDFDRFRNVSGWVWQDLDMHSGSVRFRPSCPGIVPSRSDVIDYWRERQPAVALAADRWT